MYLPTFAYYLSDENSHACNVRGRAAGLGRSTGATLSAGPSNKSVKKGADCGRGGSQLATSRPGREDHAGISDDSGKSLTHTHTHTHTDLYTYSFLHISQTRILLLVMYKDEQVVWVAVLEQHSQLVRLTSQSRRELVVVWVAVLEEHSQLVRLTSQSRRETVMAEEGAS